LPIQLENRCGWMIPIRDRVAQQIILREVNDIPTISRYCKQFRSVIQAGGNIGIWPVALSKKFDRVYTVEPDEANHAALEYNTRNFPTIAVNRAAFGALPGSGAIDHIDPDNIGAHQVKDGSEFDIVTIDSLGVEDCDLLQLDVEGFEHFAILGAVETIKKSSPVICLELKGLGKRYGVDDQETIDFLADLGYKVIEKIHRDVIFTRS
jgi:FkbM family methyltransferase